MLKINLSVCLIVKNEEKMLEECLLSVKDIAHEIILVDTGSSDKTIEIAEKYNCKIIREQWNDDFSYARNISLDNASGTHILVIDADERLINPETVFSTIENSKENIGGWLIQIISNANQNNIKSDNIYVNNLLRLFINNKKFRYKGIIHEQIVNQIIENDYLIENTNIKILHLGYAMDANSMNKKQNRNLKLLNKQIANNPNDYYSIFQRAKTQLALEKLKEAEQDIQHFIEIAPKTGTIFPQALNYGAIIAFRNQNIQTAISRAEQSLTLIPRQAFANYILAEIYYSKSEFSKAINHYSQTEVEIQNPSTKALIIGDYQATFDEIQFKIGKSYLALKEYDKALTHFTLGNNFNPRDINNIIGLANIKFHNDDYSAAKDLLDKANSISPNNPVVLNYLKQLNISLKTISLREDKENMIKNFNINNIIPLRLNKTNPILSLSMIVKNEEYFLPDCLESVRGVVDEIVLVDTGSSDRTIEIAEKYGATVFHREWKDDFAYARNEALKQCKGKWILYLDADERLKEESKEELLYLINNSKDEIGGYICNIESLHLQSDGKTDIHRGGYPRLFRNYTYPIIYFEGRIHEQITPSIFALNKAIDFSNIEIKHLGYDTSLEVMEKKVRRNYTLLIKHVQEEPNNAYAWFQLGQTLGMMNLYKESENAVQMAVSLGTLKSSIACSAYSLLAQYAKARKNYEEALNYANKSLEIVPEQVYTNFLKALIYLAIGKPEIAEQIILNVIEIKNKKRGAPHSGFDIELELDYIQKGLELAREKIAEKIKNNANKN